MAMGIPSYVYTLTRAFENQRIDRVVDVDTLISGFWNRGFEKPMENTFGQVLSEARKQQKLSQKELAEKLKKEDGAPISPQYLNDIEHDRRNPPSEFILEQIAAILKIPRDVLSYYADRMPSDVPKNVDGERVVAAYQAFRKALKGKS